MRTLIVLTFLGLLSFIFTASPGPVSADEGDIKVIDQNVESQFPEGILFTVTVSSSHEIDDIRVFFKKLGNTRQTAYRPVEFEPGAEVTGVSLLKSGGLGSYFPPGTKIEYSFEVSDKSGAVLRTEDREFVYEDSRFEWHTVTSGLITVYYYGEYVENRAETVLDAASQALDRMLPVLGITPEEPLRIVTYNNYRHMSKALPFRSQATTERLRTEGMAFSDERVLLVHGFDTTVKGTASHEFTHLLVAEAAGRASGQVPSWLNEGLAEYGNIDPTDDYDAALRYGIFTRRLRPLWYQSSFGGTPDDIIIAYGQARSVVLHMIETYGNEKMAELLRVFQNTRDIDAALMQVYGFDQYGLDSEWRGTQNLEPLPPPAQLEKELAASQPEKTENTPVAADTAPADAASADSAANTTEKTAENIGAQPTPGPTPAASIEDPTGPAAPQGCGASPIHAGGRIMPDLAMLALLAGPLGLMLVRRPLRRRYPSAVSNHRSVFRDRYASASTGPWIKGVIYRVAQQVEGEQQDRQGPHRK